MLEIILNILTYWFLGALGAILGLLVFLGIFEVTLEFLIRHKDQEKLSDPCIHDWYQCVRWSRYCGMCGEVQWKHLRWFPRWAYWNTKRTWI